MGRHTRQEQRKIALIGRNTRNNRDAAVTFILRSSTFFPAQEEQSQIDARRYVQQQYHNQKPPSHPPGFVDPAPAHCASNEEVPWTIGSTKYSNALTSGDLCNTAGGVARFSGGDTGIIVVDGVLRGARRASRWFRSTGRNVNQPRGACEFCLTAERQEDQGGALLFFERVRRAQTNPALL